MISILVTAGVFFFLYLCYRQAAQEQDAKRYLAEKYRQQQRKPRS